MAGTYPQPEKMIRSRLPILLLAGLFLLHLVGAGSSAAMDMGGNGEMQMMSPAVSTSPAGADVVPAADSSSEEEAPCPIDSPCDMPGMPPGCSAALPCPSALSIPAHRTEFHLVSDPSAGVALAALRAPHTRLSPPEIPPPRA